jgi:hypothetical protein
MAEDSLEAEEGHSSGSAQVHEQAGQSLHRHRPRPHIISASQLPPNPGGHGVAQSIPHDEGSKNT